MNFNVNIVDTCNLHCPSCPIGRGDLPKTAKQMDDVLLRRICEKAAREVGHPVFQLYDVTEPTLHKNLPHMIWTARQFGQVELSTNASVPGVDWQAIVAEAPRRITVSLSGETQVIHEKGHPGSKIAVVHESMAEIEKAKRKLNSKTDVTVLFHRYRYNLHEEMMARGRALDHGFGFAGLWATMLHPYGQRNTAECVVGPDEAKRFMAQYPIDGRKCLVLRRNVNINVNGVATMCAGYGHEKADFLSVPLNVIQKVRADDPLCRQCAASGMSRYVCRDPHLDKFNENRVGWSWYYAKSRWLHWLFHLREVMTR